VNTSSLNTQALRCLWTLEIRMWEKHPLLWLVKSSVLPKPKCYQDIRLNRTSIWDKTRLFIRLFSFYVMFWHSGYVINLGGFGLLIFCVSSGDLHFLFTLISSVLHSQKDLIFGLNLEPGTSQASLPCQGIQVPPWILFVFWIPLPDSGLQDHF